MSEESEDFLVASLVRRNWLVDGLLSPLISPYVHYLRAQGYADNSIRAYLKAIAHFAYWGGLESVDLSDINAPLINRFLHAHLPVCVCPAPRPCHVSNIRPALKHLVIVLRQQGYPCKARPRLTPASHELTKCRQYLLAICGFAEPTTVHYRLKHISDFLERQFGAGTVDISCVTASDIDGCVMDYAKRWRPASLAVIRASLKSYLKFRALEGDETRHLIAALPVLADWSHTTLPKALSEVQLTAFMQTFDLSKPIGQRDYAIARCLIDLGLRGCEVASLTIESVDWRNAILTIANSKGRRILQLPLP
ncbi:tyrosine-type recombinase/integrase [Glaciimonas sp. GG7]